VADSGTQRGRTYLDELEQVLGEWSQAHERLERGDRHLGGGRNSAQVQAAFQALDPYYVRLRDAARQLVEAEGNAPAALATILAVEPDYLTRMERLVGIYEHEAEARVDRLIWSGWLVTGLALLGLAAVGWLILRPASRLIRGQVAALRSARDALEERVRERTTALELAYAQLEREACERALADERHRALLEQFGHAARTTTIGEMASGLAHELNQPLGAIANYAEGCLVALDSPQPPLEQVRDAIGKVLATTLRAGEIVKRIRRFVTRHEIARDRFDPARLVREVDEFFQDEAGRRGVSLRIETAPDLPYLLGDPVQIQQVLVNLVRNAFEALAASKPVEPTVVMTAEPGESGAVEFRVSDNGEGISEERLGRVFDAYFSTRDEGMGMGLAISRTIVEAHGGRINVESLPGVRTTFRFTLPAADVEDAGANGLHR
jgi:signal transduction histidine kinase